MKKTEKNKDWDYDKTTPGDGGLCVGHAGLCAKGLDLYWETSLRKVHGIQKTKL